MGLFSSKSKDHMHVARLRHMIHWTSIFSMPQITLYYEIPMNLVAEDHQPRMIMTGLGWGEKMLESHTSVFNFLCCFPPQISLSAPAPWISCSALLCFLCMASAVADARPNMGGTLVSIPVQEVLDQVPTPFLPAVLAYRGALTGCYRQSLWHG